MLNHRGYCDFTIIARLSDNQTSVLAGASTHEGQGSPARGDTARRRARHTRLLLTGAKSPIYGKNTPKSCEVSQ
jgi:hypothetical protein